MESVDSVHIVGMLENVALLGIVYFFLDRLGCGRPAMAAGR